MSILDGASNDPIVDRFKIEDQGIEHKFFIGVFDGESRLGGFRKLGKRFRR